MRDHNEFGQSTLLRGTFDDTTPGLQITVTYDGLATLRITDPSKANDPNLLQKCVEYLKETSATASDSSKLTLVSPNWLPQPSKHHHVKAVECVSNAPGTEPKQILDLCAEVNAMLKQTERQTWLSQQGA